MKIGFIGRAFQTVKALFTPAEQRRAAQPQPEPQKTKGIVAKAAHLIRVRLASGSGIFGPAFIPDAAHSHESRQTCRARLRGLMFQKVSSLYPGMSRRDRRRHASLAARLEYRRMMADDTNAIADDERRLLERLARVS